MEVGFGLVILGFVSIIVVTTRKGAKIRDYEIPAPQSPGARLVIGLLGVLVLVIGFLIISNEQSNGAIAEAMKPDKANRQITDGGLAIVVAPQNMGSNDSGEVNITVYLEQPPEEAEDRPGAGGVAEPGARLVRGYQHRRCSARL